jgi:hypothetical protein
LSIAEKQRNPAGKIKKTGGVSACLLGLASSSNKVVNVTAVGQVSIQPD